MTGPIVVGVALRDDDSAPIALGRQLARLTGVPLTLVHGYPYQAPAAIPTPEYYSAVRERALAALERVAAPLRPELDVTVRAGAGSSPAAALHDVATALDAPLVVVGSTHRGRVGRVMPGSVTARLLHGAPCAVAVAPRGYTGADAVRRIGVGFVDTPEGRDALAGAALLAELCGATVRVLTVHQPEAWGAALLEPGDFDAAAAQKQSLDRAVATAQRARELLPTDVLQDVEVIDGEPAASLISLSSDLDLIVCGSRGYGPVRAVVLGGVTRRLVDGAACPVLVLPRMAGDTLERLAPRRGEAVGG
jgi:nucleotide-binding universal stress UspA family protein